MTSWLTYDVVLMTGTTQSESVIGVVLEGNYKQYIFSFNVEELFGRALSAAAPSCANTVILLKWMRESGWPGGQRHCPTSRMTECHRCSSLNYHSCVVWVPPLSFFCLRSSPLHPVLLLPSSSVLPLLWNSQLLRSCWVIPSETILVVLTAPCWPPLRCLTT